MTAGNNFVKLLFTITNDFLFHFANSHRLAPRYNAPPFKFNPKISLSVLLLGSKY